MKIIITESQYKKLITENRFDKMVDKIIDKHYMDDLPTMIDILYKQYALDIEALYGNEKLKNFISDKFDGMVEEVENGQVHSWNIRRKFDDRVVEYLDSMFTGYVNDEIQVTYNMKSPISQLRRLNALKDVNRTFGDGAGTDDYITDVMEGVVNDAIDYIYRNYNSMDDILKRLATIKKLFSKNSRSSQMVDTQFQNIGKKYGYTMVPKPLEWSFRQGGGRIQQIIDYIKDKPELPKKTRKGWMDYIGEDPNRAGWNSRLWRAVQQAGIIDKVRDGRSFTYTLGPNAEAFEQGKLVGY